MPDLGDCRLVFVANAEGVTGVGDYAQTFVDAVRPHVAEVVEVRTGGPGDETVRGVREARSRVRAAVRGGTPGAVLVHAELSAGALAPFWSLAGVRTVPTTATVHDPPLGVWFPARTSLLAKHRLLVHAVHYPLLPVTRRLEARLYRGRVLVALSETGRRSLEEAFTGVRTTAVEHVVDVRPAIAPAASRPRAIGFFGMVYRGKGYDEVLRIREQLPADIPIRIAGRGTDSLPPTAGIDIVGEVDGPDEDAFFASVRALVVPYSKRHFYGDAFPASGVVARSLAYRTPMVCSGYGALGELTTDTGAVVVDADSGNALTAGFVAAIAALVDDPDRLTELSANAATAAAARSGERVAEEFAALWAQLMAGQLPP